ncbi:MAG: AAA family ATPase [Oscillospiraceae bacterium]|nr:AAA family ATPase [Oscillospiraceae bacterium]
MSKIIAVTNQKGGVGKTTTCAGLCGGLAKLGNKVLAIDLDPQGNLSFSLGAEVEDNFTIYDVMKGNCDIGDAIIKGETCDVVPSNILLSGLELEMTGVGREYVLREQLNYVKKNYDYIILDTPPALSVLTINAYTASDELIIPMLCEVLSLQGIAQLRQTIFAVKRYYNKQLVVRGILLNKYNPHYTLTKEVEELAQMIAEQLDTVIFKSKISNSVTIAEAPAHGESIITYSPKSRSAMEYMAFIKELTSQSSKKTKAKKSGDDK